MYLPDRFIRSFDISSSGCWLWNRPLNAKGYAFFTIEGKRWSAHRFSWTKIKSEIPSGMQIDHMCRVRNCVNPEHLRVVTISQNVTENSMSPTAINKVKTHCIHGHEFTPENIIRYPKKPRSRECRLCHQARSRKHWLRSGYRKNRTESRLAARVRRLAEQGSGAKSEASEAERE